MSGLTRREWLGGFCVLALIATAVTLLVVGNFQPSVHAGKPSVCCLKNAVVLSSSDWSDLGAWRRPAPLPGGGPLRGVRRRCVIRGVSHLLA